MIHPSTSDLLHRAIIGDFETVGNAETTAQQILERCKPLYDLIMQAKEHDHGAWTPKDDCRICDALIALGETLPT